MPTVGFQLKSLKFVDALRRRAESFAGTRISYRITVPEDLKFWYWLEWGTAGQQKVNDAPYRDAPYRTKYGEGETYPIDPKRKPFLSWPDASEPGGYRFAFHVDHPGIRPRLIYRGNRKTIMAYAMKVIGGTMEAMMASDNVTVQPLRDAVKSDVMKKAIDIMGEELAKQAPGIRAKDDGGKLGKSASETWIAEAQVIETE